jgi:hypothetical protein
VIVNKEAPMVTWLRSCLTAGDEMTLEVTGTRGDKMALVVKRQK